MVLYALCECTPRQAGFDPFIIPASEPCPSDINQLFETPISAKQSKGDRVVLVLGDQMIKSFRITTGSSQIEAYLDAGRLSFL